ATAIVAALRIHAPITSFTTFMRPPMANIIAASRSKAKSLARARNTSPNPRDTVLFEHTICRHDREITSERLCGNETVEWVAMMKWEALQTRQVRERDR